MWALQAVDANKVRWWMEMLKPTTATVLARYHHPSWPADAAITRNSWGKGEVTYVGFMPTDAMIERILGDAAHRANVSSSELRFPIIARGGNFKNGHSVHYILHYSAKNAQIPNTEINGRELLTGRRISVGGYLSITAWGVAIIEENQK